MFHFIFTFIVYQKKLLASGALREYRVPGYNLRALKYNLYSISRNGHSPAFLHELLEFCNKFVETLIGGTRILRNVCRNCQNVYQLAK